MSIHQLVQGHETFKTTFKSFQPTMDQTIKEGQTPHTLFITCCDSRITPDLMFSTKPNELFVLRNIGNFVPHYDQQDIDHSTGAAIEYAVNILGVKHIVICGHSNCGACKSLHHTVNHEDPLPHLKTWLSLGQTVKQRTLKTYQDQQHDLYSLTEKTSIVFQLENLHSFPCVQQGIQKGTLSTHGWYYKLDDGSIESYDESTKTFVQGI